MAAHQAAERFEEVIAVRPEDIDQFDHVNNVVYVRWVQEVATAHWNAAATAAQKETIGWVVVRHEIDYVNSTRLGDKIIARTWVGAAEKNIFERHTELLRAADMKTLARARSLWCPINLKTFKPTRVDADVYERFSIPVNHP
ncbi:MAG TPA: acyl-CoA thioesterase [Bacteroidota bacterium]|nr:acyl-CoA thioesterase [Bacteroidota bacterium]